ncbi:hypothetical protein BH09PSE1_BH09PSE1_30930 [soil metagenome]
MRKALTFLVASIAVLALASCGDQGATKASPKTFHPDEQAAAVMPDDAPPQEETGPDAVSAAPGEETPAAAGAASCASELGAAASARLVERCIAVSPATHPPCNAANACAMIRDEIDRSCAMYGPNEDKPAQCAG